MWAEVLTEITWNAKLDFWLWIAYYPLCNVSSSHVRPWKGKSFFSGFGLLAVVCAMSAPVMGAGVLIGVPWKAKFVFSSCGLLYPLCNVSHNNVRGVLTGVPWKVKFVYFWFWLDY